MSDNLWQDALRRTRRGPLGQLAGLFGDSGLHESFWDDLEAALVQADLGVGISAAILDELRAEARARAWSGGDQVLRALRERLLGKLRADAPEEIGHRPHVIMLVGVNGSGKTTSAARLAHRWRQQGASVLLAAADTFRAAAGEQLARWAEKLSVPLIAGERGSDPGAVVYRAAEAAQARSADVLIIDTSGRMHTSHNLMAELQKIHRVAGKVVDGAPHEVLLVLDATTGQNGLRQAAAFLDAIPIDGVVLAKLDSSARGGIAVAICQELGLPITYVGLGERMDDLTPFDPEAFVEGLLGAGVELAGRRQDAS